MSRQSLRWLLRNQSGNVLLLAGAAMPVLIGAAGLATDTVQWSLWKRQLQREADSAAISGAFAVAQGFSASESANADVNRIALVPLSHAPVVENAPTAGSYAGNAKAVRVILRTGHALPFSQLLGIRTPTISAEATASVVSEGTYCVVSLETTTATGITLQGNASVDLGCGLITNSRSANAVSAGGSSTVKATPVAAVGGVLPSTNYVSPTTLMPHSMPEADPYASLPTPALEDCANPAPKVNVNPQATKDISPGCYRGFDIKGVLKMSPGTYYVDGGTFSVGSQATVIGTGVTIILTSSVASTNPSSVATVSINGGATLQLSAPTSGTYAGVIFYQDRRATDSASNLINGNASSFLQGSFYFPSQEVQFSGTSGMSTDCLQIVGRRVTFTGNSRIANNCPANSGAHAFTGSRVRLVA